MRQDDLRRAVGYVVEIRDSDLLINLLEESRAHVSGHSEGLSSIGRPGDLIGVEGGTSIIVARVSSVAFAEPKEIRSHSLETTQKSPLRQMRASVIGYLDRVQGTLQFTVQNWVLPVLGASAFPLSDNETQTTISASDVEEEKRITIGSDSRNFLVPVQAGIDKLLARHFAVLGSTGEL